MIPTFLQKRRSHLLNSVLTLLAMTIILFGQAMNIATIIAERDVSQPGKLAQIGMTLIITLGAVGIIEHTRR